MTSLLANKIAPAHHDYTILCLIHIDTIKIFCHSSISQSHKQKLLKNTNEEATMDQAYAISVLGCL